jgi:glycosyltransferase involved in cell wall biosynthesis
LISSTSSVAFVIPCYNEEASVGHVIESCRRAYADAQIFVFDNNSVDKTSQLAQAAGAQVINSPFKGKGTVLRHAFQLLNMDYLIVIDGDGTYSLSALGSMIDVMNRDNCDMVVCARKAEHKKAYPRFHYLGNLFFSTLLSFILRRPLKDVLSGFRIISKKLYKNLPLKAQHFEIEIELSLKAEFFNLKVQEVEGVYLVRRNGSASKLKTFSDGASILIFIFRTIFQHVVKIFRGRRPQLIDSQVESSKPESKAI